MIGDVLREMTVWASEGSDRGSTCSSPDGGGVSTGWRDGDRLERLRGVTSLALSLRSETEEVVVVMCWYASVALDEGE